jgi:hypothetical protein
VARHHSRRVTLGSKDFDPDVGFETARLLSGSTGGGGGGRNDNSSSAAAAAASSGNSSGKQYGEGSTSSSGGAAAAKASDSTDDVGSDVAVDCSEEWVQVQPGAGLYSTNTGTADVAADAAASTDTAAATANSDSTNTSSSTTAAGHSEPPTGPAPPVPEEQLPPTLNGEPLGTSPSTSALLAVQMLPRCAVLTVCARAGECCLLVLQSCLESALYLYISKSLLPYSY